MARLDQKVAVVSGAGSGIGKASATTLARHGARVIVSDLRIDAAEAVATEIRDAGGEAVAVACDIAEETQIAAMIGSAITHYGRLDIMHNNAALLKPDVVQGDTHLLDIPTSLWDEVMQVTLRGTMLGCKYAVQEMRKTGGGSIINTSSNYGVRAFYRMPAYGVSKAAINMLSEYVATAYGEDHVRCNAIAPSMVDTPTLRANIPPELIQFNVDSSLLPYLAEPSDIANIVLFLASDEGRYITGQVIRADGGMTNHMATYADARRFFAEK